MTFPTHSDAKDEEDAGRTIVQPTPGPPPIDPGGPGNVRRDEAPADEESDPGAPFGDLGPEPPEDSSLRVETEGRGGGEIRVLHEDEPPIGRGPVNGGDAGASPEPAKPAEGTNDPNPANDANGEVRLIPEDEFEDEGRVDGGDAGASPEPDDGRRFILPVEPEDEALDDPFRIGEDGERIRAEDDRGRVRRDPDAGQGDDGDGDDGVPRNPDAGQGDDGGRYQEEEAGDFGSGAPRDRGEGNDGGRYPDEGGSFSREPIRTGGLGAYPDEESGGFGPGDSGPAVPRDRDGDDAGNGAVGRPPTEHGAGPPNGVGIVVDPIPGGGGHSEDVAPPPGHGVEAPPAIREAVDAPTGAPEPAAPASPEPAAAHEAAAPPLPAPAPAEAAPLSAPAPASARAEAAAAFAPAAALGATAAAEQVASGAPLDVFHATAETNAPAASESYPGEVAAIASRFESEQPVAFSATTEDVAPPPTPDDETLIAASLASEEEGGGGFVDGIVDAIGGALSAVKDFVTADSPDPIVVAPPEAEPDSAPAQADDE